MYLFVLAVAAGAGGLLVLGAVSVARCYFWCLVLFVVSVELLVNCCQKEVEAISQFSASSVRRLCLGGDDNIRVVPKDS